MKKIIIVFIASLFLLPDIYFFQVAEADARRGYNHHQRRTVKRAYVAGAVRGNRRAHVRSGVRQHHRRAVRRDRGRRAVRGAVRIGVGAAIINNI